MNQFQRQFPADAVQSELIDTHLAAVENYVAAYFAPPPPPAPPATPTAPSPPPPTPPASAAGG